MRRRRRKRRNKRFQRTLLIMILVAILLLIGIIVVAKSIFFKDTQNETTGTVEESTVSTAIMETQDISMEKENVSVGTEAASIDTETQTERETETADKIEKTERSISEAAMQNVKEVKTKPSSVAAKAAILIDATNGQVLFEQNAETALPPASTTKMMTALLTVEAIERGELSLSDIVTVDNHARNITPMGGSVLAMPIEEGEEVSIKDLLYAVLLKSDCVCCNILAEQVCGDVDTFVQRMNERAKELGCENTIFLNTHGFKEKGHLTSAHDLARMAAEAMQHSIFYEIADTEEYIIPETNLHEAREIRNTNWLLGSMWDRNVRSYNRDYEYPYAHGIKTGYTEEAGHCLVSFAQKNDKKLVCVILGAEIDTDENTGYLVQHMYDDSILLYNWGFSAMERGEIVKDESCRLIDLADKMDIIEQTETAEIEEANTQTTGYEEQESTVDQETEQVAGSNVSKQVLLTFMISLLVVVLLGIGFLIYRKFYYFD